MCAPDLEMNFALHSVHCTARELAVQEMRATCKLSSASRCAAFPTKTVPVCQSCDKVIKMMKNMQQQITYSPTTSLIEISIKNAHVK